MRLGKTKSEKLVAIKDKEYVFDDASLKYASLTDAEAKARKIELKEKIKDLEGNATLSQNPPMLMELRALKSSLAWMRLNKHKSKYFKINTSGASMRRAKRHPETPKFNDNKSKEKLSESRLQREKV